jgi:type IV pilus assembly protein PilE
MYKISPRASHPALKSSSPGFTLIELMIVVTIVGVLASLAIPQFWENVLQSRRTEARAALEEIRNLEMEFFQTYKRFGTRDEIGYGNAVTPGGFYQVSVASAALAFSTTATAIGNQLDDEECRIFSVTTTGTYEATDSNGNPSPECW